MSTKANLNRLNDELNEMLLVLLLNEKGSFVKETARKSIILDLIEKAPWTIRERKSLVERLTELDSPSVMEVKIDRHKSYDWFAQ